VSDVRAYGDVKVRVSKSIERNICGWASQKKVARLLEPGLRHCISYAVGWTEGGRIIDDVIVDLHASVSWK